MDMFIVQVVTESKCLLYRLGFKTQTFKTQIKNKTQGINTKTRTQTHSLKTQTKTKTRPQDQDWDYGSHVRVVVVVERTD